jgi:hypothetical protein
MTDFKKLKVAELRAELAARNLPQTGKRDELIERLEEYEFHNALPAESEPINEENSAAPMLDEPLKIVEDAHPFISPVFPPSPGITLGPTAEEIEEEKRRQRALRFGLDLDPVPAVKIEVTIKRLEHALPDRPHHHHGRNRRYRHHKHRDDSAQRHVSINKP